MKEFKYIILLSCLWGLSSCYKDKGNYDYKDIGSITIEQPTDIPESKVLQSVMQDSVLHINPIVKLEGIKETDMSYIWDYAIKTSKNPQFTVLSKEKVLNVTCKMPANQYDVRFKATNNLTGVSTYAYYTLTVMSVTTRCVLLLCEEKPQEFDISSCPIYSSRGVIGRNLYSKRNNGELLHNATKLIYWNNIRSEQFLWVCEDGGGKTLSPFDLTNQGDANEWFFETPQRIEVTNIYGDVNGNDYFILCDGGVYYIDNSVAPPFKARLRELSPDNADYHIEAATNVSIRKARTYAFWDTKNSRFLYWDKSNKALTKFTVDENTPFNPNEMKGYTPLFLGDGVDGKAYTFFKDLEGKTHMFLFSGSRNDIVPKEHRILPEEVRLDLADCIWANRAIDVIYYTIKNQIYVYEPNVPQNPTHVIYTDPDPNMRFVEIFNYSTYDYNIFVAGNNGNQGYLYDIALDTSGNIEQATETNPDVIVKNGPFNKIIDMEYLLKDY